MRASLRVVVLLTCTLLAFGVLPPALAAESEIPIRITVNGLSGYVPSDSTVGEVLIALQREPRRGHIVSVTGRILRANAVSGRVLLDGNPVKYEQTLLEGQRITVQDGPNVREPVERVLAPAASTANPMRSLPPTYGALVYATRGKISGEVVQESSVQGVRVKPAVALTFDDGPHPTYTPRVLAVLRRYGVKATFFVTGRNTERYPSIVRALRDAGMSVQNHSYNHENLGRASAAAVRANLTATTRAIRAAGLPAPKWFRPPYGAYTATTVQAASSLGMRTALWSTDTSDYTRPASSVIAQRALRAPPGGVILLHDSGGDRTNTIAALPSIIEGLLRRGYRFVALT